MRVVVTGGAGFIGSNLVHALNQEAITDVIVVDDLEHGDKFLNLVDCEISDYLDKAEFLELVRQAKLGPVDAIFHQGACSDTMEHNGQFMMQNNYRYTCELFDYAQQKKIPFLFASSAAVYGGSTQFIESREVEKPLNVYGYSKFLFDQVLRRKIESGLTAPVFGFRYFNVYGDREQHKGRMASVAFHNFNQFMRGESVKLFGEYGGYQAGCQQRDFVSVEDVVRVNLHFLKQNQTCSGVYNLGTGRAQTFNDVALTVLNTLREFRGENVLSLEAATQEKQIEYIEFPDALKGKYQSFTQASLDKLREAGYSDLFLSVEQGVERYVKKLIKKMKLFS